MDNCIPLCFNCHADVGHYNPNHPKGTKYSESELRMHRERWYDAIKSLALETQKVQEDVGHDVVEAYEGQEIDLFGRKHFLARRTMSLSKRIPLKHIGSLCFLSQYRYLRLALSMETHSKLITSKNCN